jgi:thioredoxin
MNVINLTEKEFIQHVADYHAPHPSWHYFGNMPAIVDFYAGWCGPCRVLAPVLEELAAVYKDQIVVYKVDVDRCEALAEAYDIRSIPTTLFIPMKGRPVKMVGAISKKELDIQIHEILLKDHYHHAEV